MKGFLVLFSFSDSQTGCDSISTMKKAFILFY